MKLDESATGVYVISVTPFTTSGELDLASVPRLVDFYLSTGVDGITVLGVLGEAPKLTADESRRFVRAVLQHTGGRVPVIVGVSSPGFAAMQELSCGVMDEGAAGVMVAPVPTIRTDDQVHDYYGQVAETLSGIPFVLQDHPQSTGVQIGTGVLLRILKAIPSCAMVKHEEWPGLGKLTALRAASARGDVRRVSILGGNGGLFLPEELERGSDGAMTGFAYPEMMVEVCRRHGSGDLDGMRDVFDAYLPLARYEQQPGIGLAARKYVLAKRGAIGCAALRKPGARMSPEDVAEVERMIARQTERLRKLGL